MPTFYVPPATLPRPKWGAPNEFPHLDPVVSWEEVRPTGVVAHCSVNTRLEARLQRWKEAEGRILAEGGAS